MLLLRNLETLCAHQPAAAAVALEAFARRPDPTDAAAPAPAVRLSIENAAERYRRGEALVVAGTGPEGTLVRALADGLPTLAHRQRPPVYVVEPDADHLLGVLSSHDLAGSDGPLADPRYRWYVGDAWAAALHQDLDRDPALALPQGGMAAGPYPQQKVAAVLKQTRQARAVRLTHHLQANAAAYASFDPHAWRSLVTDHGPRAPRVVLTASRFTSVLRYSIRDCADGFAALGWDVRLVTEPSDHHTLTLNLMADAVAEFKPDLFFTINQPRHLFTGHVPRGLPFASWYQDQSGHLMNAEAGRSFGPRDFVLSVNGPLYTGQLGYPRKQIVALPKLTRFPDPRPPAARVSKGRRDDSPRVVYVSNASAPPSRLAAGILRRYYRADRAFGRFVRSTLRDLRAVYRNGESLPTLAALGRRLDQAAHQHVGAALADNIRQPLLMELFQSVNNAAYRQQALGWVADACTARGARLELYGAGWDAHPRFAAYARGPVTYGPELESLTRDAAINLQIIPSVCTHQRLIDGVAAGGFFLIRGYPSDRVLPPLTAFLRDHLPPHVHRLPDARAHLTPGLRTELDRLLDDAADFTDFGETVDPIDFARGGVEGRVFDPHEPPLPGYDDVAFNNATELAAALDRFLHDADTRAEVVARQQRSIRERLTYRAGLDRAVREIADRLGGDVPAEATAEEAA